MNTLVMGSLVTCILSLQFKYAYPEDKTYWDTRELQCVVEATRSPLSIGQLDNKVPIYINCEKEMNKLRLSDNKFYNQTKQWKIFPDDCF